MIYRKRVIFHAVIAECCNLCNKLQEILRFGSYSDDICALIVVMVKRGT